MVQYSIISSYAKTSQNYHVNKNPGKSRTEYVNRNRGKSLEGNAYREEEAAGLSLSDVGYSLLEEGPTRCLGIQFLSDAVC